jgi:hypothetical protein
LESSATWILGESDASHPPYRRLGRCRLDCGYCLRRSFVIYPVKVSFSFDYKGQHVETSYLTAVRAGLGNFIEVSLIRWMHERDKASVILPDGSLIILRPEWPYEWREFTSGEKNVSRGRWLWLDSPETPRQIVYGDGATHRSSRRLSPPQFTWLEITATIERVSERFLPQALWSDRSRDVADKLQVSPMGGLLNYSGTLFADVGVIPIIDSAGGTKIEELKSAPDWLGGSGDCRVKPIRQTDIRSLDGLVARNREQGLLFTDGIWSANGGPYPGEPVVMYSTNTHVEITKSLFQCLNILVGRLKWSTRWSGWVKDVLAYLQLRERCMKLFNSTAAILY